MHCYGGKVKLAIAMAEKWGWSFSIPANLSRSESFQRLVQKLPPECILTETDAPFLSPIPQTRNEPANVVQTVGIIAKLRNWTDDEAKSKIWANYQRLFGTEKT